MNIEEALIVLDTALEKEFLNNIQELVFRQAWAGRTYIEIAENCGYNPNYIKDVGYKLWKLLSKAFDEEVTKSNFRSVLRRRYVASQRLDGPSSGCFKQAQYSLFMCDSVRSSESPSPLEESAAMSVASEEMAGSRR